MMQNDIRVKRLKESSRLLFLLGYFFLPISTPFRFFQVILSLKTIFISNSRSEYCALSPYRAINSTFYYVEELMLNRYGHNGYSFEYSLGRSMKNFFYFTRASLFIFKNLGGALTTIIFYFFLAFSLLIVYYYNILGKVSILGFIILIIALFSTTSYYLAFEGQNYNIIGWSMFPLLIGSLISQNWIITTFILLIISFCSFTAAIIAINICIIIGLILTQIIPFLVTIPATIKIGSHFMPIISDSLSELRKVLTFIGFNSTGKEKRKREHFKSLFIAVNGYFFGLYAIFTISYGMLLQWNSPIGKQLFFILIFILLLHIINSFIARFADRQTIHMLFFVIATMCALNINKIEILIPFLISINPHPLSLGFTGDIDKVSLFFVPKRKPYSIRPILELLDLFFQVIPLKSRLIELHEFNDNDYLSVFKKLRPIHEIILYSANLKSINIVPDFIAIMDSWNLNMPLSKILKQNPTDAIKACETLGSPYVMILVDNKTYNENEWTKYNFLEISRLNWEDMRFFLEDSGVLMKGDFSYRILELLTCTSSMITGGNFISICPNRIKISFNSNDHCAVIKYIYDSNWKPTNNSVIVKKHNSDWPWIEIYAPNNMDITLIYS